MHDERWTASHRNAAQQAKIELTKKKREHTRTHTATRTTRPTPSQPGYPSSHEPKPRTNLVVPAPRGDCDLFQVCIRGTMVVIPKARHGPLCHGGAAVAFEEVVEEGELVSSEDVRVRIALDSRP